MLYTYNLNINTNWDYLPWKKINTRLIVIQNKIYKAAKQYNLKYLHYLQKYLLNSNEAKLSSIKYITNKFFTYYKNNKKIKYIVFDNFKFNIFKNLYKYHINNNDCFIIDNIKQYLIYLCIKPEWQAKFICNFNKIENNNFKIINDINYLCNDFFKCYFSNKYFYVNKILKKISYKKCIKKILKFKFFYYKVFDFKTFEDKYINNAFEYFKMIANKFDIFLSKIFLLGLNWYHICLLKISEKQNNHNQIYFIYKNNGLNFDYKIKPKYMKHFGKIYFELLFKIQKHFLYDKKSLHKLINNQNLYNNNYYYTHIYLIKLIYPLFNLYLYYYLKKYYNNIFYNYKSININNNYINFLFYNEIVKDIYFKYFS